MTLEELAQIAGIVALACGGLWALLTFFGETTRKKLELQKLALEVQRQAAVEIRILATQQTLPNDSSRYLSVVVELKNAGTLNTRLDYSGGGVGLRVRQAKFETNGELKYGPETSYPVMRASAPEFTTPAIVLRAGSTERHTFFIPVENAGLYLLTFSIRLSDEDRAISKKAGTPEHRPASWGAREFVVVT